MWHALSRQNVFVRSAVLLTYEILLFAGITPFLWFFGKEHSISAAATAAGLCAAGAVLSLLINCVFRDPKYTLISILLGMAVNMGVPLAFGLAVHLHGGPLSKSGFLYYLAFFYLFTLAIKTVLTLPASPTNFSAEGGSPDHGR
jgi:hypothetical protein